MMPTYPTITGRKLDLAGLGKTELDFLAAVKALFDRRLEWSDFSRWWTSKLLEAGLTSKSVVYRICQDLEARVGIMEGKVSLPDYRDQLADLIEERHGSLERFCEETGIDPEHPGRVLSARPVPCARDLSRILDAMHLSLVVQPREELVERVGPELAARALAAATQQ
jgi:hypothetical protein